MDFRLLRSIRPSFQLYKHHFRKIHKTTLLGISSKNVEEVRIPVPWGHIAGKWWGDTTKQPILAIHGWQDNAGTFDPLVELLPESVSVLAVDDPGHGFSSHLPKGMLYNQGNYLLMCRRIQNYYGWTEPMNILGHSHGAVIGLIFSALYPEYVNSLVMIDAIKPITPKKNFLTKLSGMVDSTVEKMTRSAEENKKYSLEEIEKRWIAGTKGSLTSNAVRILMRRAVQLDSESGKYTFTRDPRLKIWTLHYLDINESLALASSIKCHVLAIRFTKGKIFDESLKDAPNYLSTLEKAAKSFKLEAIEGTHHHHLNSPETVAPIVKEFLEKKL